MIQNETDLIYSYTVQVKQAYVFGLFKKSCTLLTAQFNCIFRTYLVYVGVTNVDKIFDDIQMSHIGRCYQWGGAICSHVNQLLNLLIQPPLQNDVQHVQITIVSAFKHSLTHRNISSDYANNALPQLIKPVAQF